MASTLSKWHDGWSSFPGSSSCSSRARSFFASRGGSSIRCSGSWSCHRVRYRDTGPTTHMGTIQCDPRRECRLARYYEPYNRHSTICWVGISGGMRSEPDLSLGPNPGNAQTAPLHGVRGRSCLSALPGCTGPGRQWSRSCSTNRGSTWDRNQISFRLARGIPKGFGRTADLSR